MFQHKARQEWDQVRRKAFWSKLRADFAGKEGKLLNFNEVAQRFELSNAFYRGVRNVPLEKIVGSVGRYQDFTQTFLPVTDAMADRWQKIAALYLDPTSGGVPPIEVYKVGQVYFVRDGNHRVSVANQLGFVDIEAYVWEYPEAAVGLTPGRDIDAALLEAERQAFLEQTALDTLRPGHAIRFTVPGGYNNVLAQISYYQSALSQIDGQEISYDEAVTAWYDMRYEATIQIIESAGILKLFPARTPADFFIWIMRRHWELEERYGKPILFEEAAKDFKETYRPNFPLRFWLTLRYWFRRDRRLED